MHACSRCTSPSRHVRSDQTHHVMVGTTRFSASPPCRKAVTLHELLLRASSTLVGLTCRDGQVPAQSHRRSTMVPTSEAIHQFASSEPLCHHKRPDRLRFSHEICCCFRDLRSAEAMRCCFGGSTERTCASWTACRERHTDRARNYRREQERSSPPPPPPPRQESQENRHPRACGSAAIHSRSYQRAVHGGGELRYCYYRCLLHQRRCRCYCFWRHWVGDLKHCRGIGNGACHASPNDCKWTSSRNPCGNGDPSIETHAGTDEICQCGSSIWTTTTR